jgi:hypothetical protein
MYGLFCTIFATPLTKVENKWHENFISLSVITDEAETIKNSLEDILFFCESFLPEKLLEIFSTVDSSTVNVTFMFLDLFSIPPPLSLLYHKKLTGKLKIFCSSIDDQLVPVDHLSPW